MKAATIFTLIATASATALPGTIMARNGGGDGGSTTAPCTANGKPVCCDGILGILSCAVSVIGGTCNGNSYCCQTNSATGSLVNIQALQCVAI